MYRGVSGRHRFSFLVRMCLVGAILFLVLCLSTTRSCESAGKLRDLQTAVSQVAEFRRTSATLSSVKIGNTECNVYVVDGARTKNAADVSSGSDAAKFYTCVNCVFADWLYRKLFSLVGPDGSGMTKGFDLWRITKYAARFANVLFDFVDAYTFASMVDVDLLKAVLWLGLAADLPRKTAYAWRDDDPGSATAQALLTLNAVQKFLALNCDVSSVRHAHEHGTPAPPAVSVRRFLRNIRPAGLGTRRDRCTGSQMLLRDVLLAPGDAVARELARVFVTVECAHRDGTATLEIGAGLAAEVARAHDPDVTLWYQKIVYRALLRLLCAKLRDAWTTTTAPRLPDAVARGFRELRFAFAESTAAPRRLARAFALLADGRELDPAQWTELKEAVAEFEESDHRRPRDGPFRTPSTDVGPSLDTAALPLDEFLATIVKKAHDYECFVRLFRTLNADDRKYYAPHARNPRAVYAFVEREVCRDTGSGRGADAVEIRAAAARDRGGPVEETRDSAAAAAAVGDAVCEAMIGIHQICYEAYRQLNADRKAEDRSHGAGVPRLRGVGQTIRSVTGSVKMVSETDVRDRCVTALSLDLAAVETIAARRLWSTGTYVGSYDETERRLYVVMAGLAECGLRACRPPDRGRLRFADRGAEPGGEIWQNDQFYVRWDEIVRRTGLGPGAELPDVTGLFERFGRGSGYEDRFASYGGAVKLYWKGVPRTADEIFPSVRHALTDAEHVYALYDVYFRFSLAAIYYETVRLADRLRTADDDHPVYPPVPADNFPGVFERLVGKYNGFLSRVVGSTSGPADSPNGRVVDESLDEEFSALGVFIDKGKPKLPRSHQAGGLRSSDTVPPPGGDAREFYDRVKNISDSARQVKIGFDQFVKYFTDTEPGEHSAPNE